MKYIKLKRYIDILISLKLFIILTPLFIIIFFLIIILDRMNPLFFQYRAGYKKKIFKVIKFKTMKNAKVTFLGSILRKYKLDELPQLINILKGDLSLVGPRPLLPAYNDKFNEFQNQRFNVMPGLTGLSQVKLVNTNSWKKKFRYDVFYAKKISLKFDIFILYLTVILFINIVFSKKIIIEDHNPFLK